MKIDSSHLTYCTNIHPAETWDEVSKNLETYVTAVHRAIAPGQAFGIGLRLSAQAAQELSEPAALEKFRAFLATNDMYVFTINAFPYGVFHGEAVKENVYLPDWRQNERVAYSNQTAQLLAELLPEGVTGSVSSVPGAFKSRASKPEQVQEMVQRLLEHVAMLRDLCERTGRDIALALEPEPCCFLETIDECVDFFEDLLLSAEARALFAKLSGCAPAECEDIIRRHLGVCLDTCHAAVEFESASEAVNKLVAAGIRIAKVQLTTALRLPEVNQASLDALRRYDEPVYLHQVIERAKDGTLRRFVDLPQAFQGVEERDPAEWRVHFHVPLHLEKLSGFFNTQPFVREILALHRERCVSPHLEVETYTWDVLPPEYRDESVEHSIVRELSWVKTELGA